MISCYEHDCVVLLVPYHNNQNPVVSINVKTDSDVDLHWQGDCLVWYAHPQNFFNCTTLCPIGAKEPWNCDSHKEGP